MKRQHGNNDSKRVGSVMVEVLITATVSSVIVGLAILAIHHLLKAQETHRHAVRDGLTEQRLARLFRRDCRDASHVESNDVGIVLSSASERRITYAIADNTIVRTWSDGKTTGSDRFASTRDWTARLELPAASRARLVLERTAGGSKRTLRGKMQSVVFEATIGRQTVMNGSSSSKSDEEDRQ